MRELKYSKRAILWFFVVVIVLSACAEALFCGGGPVWIVAVLMWVPTIAANVALFIMRRERKESFSVKSLFRDTGIRKCKFRYVALGWLIPLVYLLVPYMIYWKLYPENFAYSGVSIILILKDCLPITVLGVFISLLTALGEELGWRGFLVPALNQKLGFHKMLIITGLFWCMWHMPLLIGGGYMEGTPIWYQLPAFVLCIFPVGVITAILTLESNSVWPAAFLHAAHNNYDQSVLQLITRGDKMMYFVSETGMLTIVCAWVLAAICYISFRKNKKD